MDLIPHKKKEKVQKELVSKEPMTKKSIRYLTDQF